MKMKPRFTVKVLKDEEVEARIDELLRQKQEDQEHINKAHRLMNKAMRHLLQVRDLDCELCQVLRHWNVDEDVLHQYVNDVYIG